jgi:hypothetical protein
MNRLDFSIKLADKQQSIYQIANDLDRVFKALSKSDTVFNQIYFIARKEEKLIDINDEQSVDLLANNLLNYSLKDIKKFDKIESPDVNYSRPYGYSFGLSFREDTKSVLCLSFKMGGDSGNSIGSISLTNYLVRDYVSFKEILSTFNENLAINYSSIRLIDIEFLTIANSKYKNHLGWITYFSNDYEIKIPDDLEGIEYEYTDKGKYLILTQDNLSVDESNDDAYKTRLLELMKETAERVPEYSK